MNYFPRTDILNAMEGPSLYLAEEQLAPFRRKRVRAVSGNTKIGKERLLGKTAKDIFSWGKHLVFQFDTFAIRIHFLLFGSFAATVNGVAVTGDYKRAREPRLKLDFANGSIEMYNCSVKIFEDPDLKQNYDFSISVMSPLWDAAAALKRVRQAAEEEIADALLDQEIFAGVGNIIKNEVLWLARTHPQAKVREIPARKLKRIVDCAHSFSHDFYAWRKVFQLRKHLRIYQKGTCPRCESKVIRGKTGRRERWTYFCPACQAGNA